MFFALPSSNLSLPLGTFGGSNGHVAKVDRASREAKRRYRVIIILMIIHPNAILGAMPIAFANAITFTIPIGLGADTTRTTRTAMVTLMMPAMTAMLHPVTDTSITTVLVACVFSANLAIVNDTLSAITTCCDYYGIAVTIPSASAMPYYQ